MDTGMLGDLQTAKTIEYLLAVGFLALFVPFWKYTARLVSAPAEARETEKVAVPATVVAPRREAAGWFHVPDGYALHPGHAWAKAVGGGEVLVGADDFARAVIGRVEDVDLPAPGTVVRQGEPAWTLRGAAGPLPMISPVDGMVVAPIPRRGSAPWRAIPTARVGCCASRPRNSSGMRDSSCRARRPEPGWRTSPSVFAA